MLMLKIVWTATGTNRDKKYKNDFDTGNDGNTRNLKKKVNIWCQTQNGYKNTVQNKRNIEERKEKTYSKRVITLHKNEKHIRKLIWR